MSDQARRRLLFVLLVVSAVFAIAGAALVTYARLRP